MIRGHHSLEQGLKIYWGHKFQRKKKGGGHEIFDDQNVERTQDDQLTIDNMVCFFFQKLISIQF